MMFPLLLDYCFLVYLKGIPYYPKAKDGTAAVQAIGMFAWGQGSALALQSVPRHHALSRTHRVLRHMRGILGPASPPDRRFAFAAK